MSTKNGPSETNKCGPYVSEKNGPSAEVNCGPSVDALNGPSMSEESGSYLIKMELYTLHLF